MRIIINRLIVSIPVYTDTSICISRIHAYVTYYTIVCLLKKLYFLSRNKRRPVMAEIYRFAGFVYIISLQIYVNKFSWNKQQARPFVHPIYWRNVSETLAVFRLASKYICSLFRSLVVRLLSADLCSTAINSQRTTQLSNYTAS